MTARQRRPIDLAVRLQSWAKRVGAGIRQSLGELSAIRRELAGLSRTRPTPGPVQHLGELVRWLREGAGLSRLQLAKVTRIATSTIRNVERGRHIPTAATLRKLQSALCMSALPELAKSAGLTLGRATARKRHPAPQHRRSKAGEQ